MIMPAVGIFDFFFYTFEVVPLQKCIKDFLPLIVTIYMSGALMQVVANAGNPHRLHYNSAMNIITHDCTFTPIRFATNNSFIIHRGCDVIKSIFFKFKMAALPAGWLYKNKWTTHAFESIELRLAGKPF